MSTLITAKAQALVRASLVGYRGYTEAGIIHTFGLGFASRVLSLPFSESSVQLRELGGVCVE